MNGTDYEIHYVKMRWGKPGYDNEIMSDQILATFPNIPSAKCFLLGGYFQLKANNWDFFGTFSAPGDPIPDHFPMDVYFQRSVTGHSLGSSTSAWDDSTKLIGPDGGEIQATIDPYVFVDTVMPRISGAGGLGSQNIPVPPWLAQIQSDSRAGHAKIIWPKLPASMPQFQLQSASRLGAGANWGAVTNAGIIETNGQFEASIAMSQSQSFFRLTQNLNSASFNLFAVAGRNGALTPSGVLTNAAGSSVQFVATPKTNYAIGKWYVDGVVVQTGRPTLSLSNILSEHTVTVTFLASNDLATTISGIPLGDEGPAQVGDDFAYNITVANKGATALSGISLTDSLPDICNFVSASSTRGTVTNSGNQVTALVGTLNPGEYATIKIRVQMLAEGTITNIANATCNEIDYNPANNSAALVTTVLQPLIIITQPTSVVVATNTPNVIFSVVAGGSPPFSYQWFHNGKPVNGATNSSIAFPLVTVSDVGEYHVTVSEGSGEPEDNLQVDSLPALLLLGHIVTDIGDSGPGTLRTAIASASPGDTIGFASNIVGSITLTTGELLVSNGINVIGPIDRGIIISGNNSNRVFHLLSGTTALCNLTIANGRTNAGGAGVLTESNSVLLLTNCTISSNIANLDGSGGGLRNLGTAMVRNCTFSGNDAHIGGGIRNSGVLDIGTTTIANNNVHTSGFTPTSGGGIYSHSGTATLRSCIVAGNHFGAFVDDLDGAFTSGGFNLIGYINPGIATGFTNGVQADRVNTDAMLGPLQNNGGPTFTHALLTNSPAIDAGNSFGLITDQRGMPRTVDLASVTNAVGGDDSDIGTFELQYTPVPQGLSQPTTLINFQGTTYQLRSTKQASRRLHHRRRFPAP